MSKILLKTVQCGQRSLQSVSLFTLHEEKKVKKAKLFTIIQNKLTNDSLCVTSPGKRCAFHIELVWIQNVSLRGAHGSRAASLSVHVHNSVILRLQHQELLRGEQSTPSSCSCNGNLQALIKSVCGNYATRRGRRWRCLKTQLFVVSQVKFCLVSFDKTAQTYWGDFPCHRKQRHYW